MHSLLEVSNYTLFFYYLVSNVIYLILLVTAVVRNILHRYRLASLRLEHLRSSPFTPPISLVVPAHNEEKCIVDSVRSLLALDYPNLEIVVINDGSTDQTLEELKRAFHLRSSRVLYIPDLKSAPVRGIYYSSTQPSLAVLDKISARSKADAINAGLDAATSPYVCVVDADSILEPDSLLRIMAGVFSDPSRVMAVGGIVRILNGCRVEHGELKEVRLPERGIEVLQVIEYLRAFLIGRDAWSQFNALPIISGAFGIFNKELIKSVGGFRTASIGEDFDLVVRLHRRLKEEGKDYHISFIPDPTCWTEAPSDLRSLARQRARWHKGLLDTLWTNRDMLFRPRYGRVGALILPYMWAFEFFAPIVELVGYFTIFVAAFLGLLGREFLVLFLIFGYAFSTLISIGSVLLEEMTYRRYTQSREVARLLVYCLFEHFPYRQITMIWRLQGIWQYLRGDFEWRELKRTGAAAGQS
ncbi:MAG TPA: glycosyltransferase [Terriglobales bacterium]|nr:glycosyltransferase [Terriglobales bacterium]